jgi:hypothetical protein
MTKQQHPITPLPELVQQWYHEANLSGAPYEDVAENWAYEQHIANCAAQWGADQELEACCEWLETALVGAKPLTTELRAARRPKPEPQVQVLARVVLKDDGINYPSDVVLRQYCDDWFNSDPERTEVDPVDLCRGAIRLFAHGAVAQPEPQEPTDDELYDLWDQEGTEADFQECRRFARAVLARWGNQ